LKFIGTSLIGPVILSGILVLTGFSMILTEASAQGGMPIGDFYCWTISEPVFQTQTPILFLDQFKHEYSFTMFDPHEYCESGEKTVTGGDTFPNEYLPLGQHYTTYLVDDDFNPPVTFNVGIHNFMSYRLYDVRVGPVQEVWIPNDKIKTPPTTTNNNIYPSTDHDLHYICYPITSTHDPLLEQITIDTVNFDQTVVTLNKPILFCNPAKKTLSDGTMFNVGFEMIEQHLTCFDFLSIQESSSDIGTLDKLLDQIIAAANPPFPLNELDITVLTDDKACFESTKMGLTLGGTFVPMNNVSLMLAGAQMFGAWILPAIVASIGIAIVISRKY